LDSVTFCSVASSANTDLFNSLSASASYIDGNVSGIAAARSSVGEPLEFIEVYRRELQNESAERMKGGLIPRTRDFWLFARYWRGGIGLVLHCGWRVSL